MRDPLHLIAIGLVLVAILLVGLMMQAQSPRPSREVFAELMATVDTDGDHRVSRREWSQCCYEAQPFIAFDRNGDGYLDVDEMAAMFMQTPPSLRPASAK